MNIHEENKVEILDEKLAYVVRVRREDGSERLVVHPVTVDYDNKQFCYGDKQAEFVELKKREVVDEK